MGSVRSRDGRRVLPILRTSGVAREGYRRMRILSYYPRALVGDGGPTLAARGWARALADAGCEVRVACEAGPVTAQDERVSYVPLPHRGRGRLRWPVGIEEHLAWADVVHLHSAWVAHNAFVGRRARALRKPYVLVPHGGYEPNVLRRRAFAKRAWWRLVEASLVHGAATVHVFFEGEVRHVRHLGFEGPVIIAPNGIDVPPHPLWDGGTGGYVLWMGRYDVEHKGLDLLVEALASLPATQRPRVRLHGKDFGSGREAVKELVRDAGLERWVEVLGPVYGTEKESALVRAKAFVYPSRWEAQGLAVLEALSAGVPCIVTSTMMIAAEISQVGGAFVADPIPKSIVQALLLSAGRGAASVAARGYA
ncbi:MAG TPA: glycosyltransferase, partial [Actinomycetota bacterium]|nr:glycosyltransferase [Actinomycetota bacterium]